jgi:hypothetical protein
VRVCVSGKRRAVVPIRSPPPPFLFVHRQREVAPPAGPVATSVEGGVMAMEFVLPAAVAAAGAPAPVDERLDLVHHGAEMVAALQVRPSPNSALLCGLSVAGVSGDVDVDVGVCLWVYVCGCMSVGVCIWVCGCTCGCV